ARSQLVAAAAKRWSVAAGDCRTDSGRVLHAASNRALGYGELAIEAAQLEPARNVPLKDPGAFRLIGKSQPRLDVPQKTDGTAPFGFDTRVPGMMYAAIAHCPVFGGALKRVDTAKASRMPGVRAIVELPATTASSAAVAVVADSWWRARNALAALEVSW